MRIAVAGGAGFIGSNLCKSLIADGHEVICIDNYVTGSKKNVATLMDDPAFTLLEADITEGVDFQAEFIFNLASPASPVDYYKLPIETMMVNSLGTKNLLESARKNGSRFLMASTSEVYGDPQIPVQDETYWGHVNPNGPRSCYDEAKRFAEALIMSYWRQYEINFIIVRIFNTFGPFMRLNDGRVVPNFIKQALTGEPLTVYGDGSQTRSLCYVDDLVAGLKAAIFSEAKTEVVNLGNPNEMSVLKLAEFTRRACASDSEISYHPLPVDDPTRRRPDITKAKKLLDWEPKISLTEGLNKTIAWFKGELN